MSLKLKRPEILPVMVGTAGHVDHGKTALVRLLTGCETDRLREEQERGLTIDLGFAPCHLPGNRLVGIVDVPGHEDFIRNMVAGAASIDVLMLVVAADDGVMPQTREHLKIVRLLRPARVMAAVTKTDLVDSEMRDLVCEEVKELLSANGFPDAPVVPVSNVTCDGIGDVRRALVELIESVAREPDPRAFRMYVERVFSVKGYGTVLTGIPATGRVAVGDMLELHPAGSRHPVRALQSYKLEAETAPAHACAAVNLRDCAPEDAARGMTIAAPGIYRATSGAVAWLRNDSESVTFKRNTPVKLHAGTASVSASVRLLDVDDLKPGAEAFAHLRLANPLTLAATDRFILRTQSPPATLGGGIVLSARDYKVKRSSPYLADRLRAALEAARRGDALSTELLAGPDPAIPSAEALRLTQCNGDTARDLLAEACRNDTLIALGNETCLPAGRCGEITDAARKFLSRYHENTPYAWGAEPGHVCQHFGLSPDAAKGLARVLGRDGDIVMRHGRIGLASFEPALSTRQMEQRQAILDAVQNGGASPPARGDLKKEFGISEADMKLLTRLLIEEERIVLVGPNLLARPMYEECRQTLLHLFDNRETVQLKDFRDATGTSRNLAVALLDHFDSEGLTRRVDEGRILIGG